MANLEYFVYPGLGEFARDVMGYSQAVRVGDRIECSGQGGWDPSSTSPDQAFTKVEHEIKDEIDQAFRNVELNLKSAGGKGWTQVFRVNSYHTDLTPEVLGRMTENFGKWMPDHKPVWTAVGVTKLGVDGMHVEIEVSAHDPEGSK